MWHGYASSPSFFLITLTTPRHMKTRHDVSKCPPHANGEPPPRPYICADKARRCGEGTSLSSLFFLLKAPRTSDHNDPATQPRAMNLTWQSPCVVTWDAAIQPRVATTITTRPQPSNDD